MKVRLKYISNYSNDELIAKSSTVYDLVIRKQAFIIFFCETLNTQNTYLLLKGICAHIHTINVTNSAYDNSVQDNKLDKELGI